MTFKYVSRIVDERHRYRRWIDPRVRTLRLQDVIAYLRRRNWKELPSDRRGVFAFQEPSGETFNGKPVCQVVPDSEEHDDYPSRMFELITILAEFEDRQASEVIDDILKQARESNPNGAPTGQTQGTEATAH
jgi:hypothetical protein